MRNTGFTLAVFAIIIILSNKIYSQVSNEKPYLLTELKDVDLGKINGSHFNKINNEEAKENFKQGKYGEGVYVDAIGFRVEIKLKEQASFFKLKNKTRVWLYKITSEQAKGLELYFYGYQLKKGSRLFIYDPLNKEFFGPYTEKNNEKDSLFISREIKSQTVIVEYSEEENGESYPEEIIIKKIFHTFQGSNINRNFREESSSPSPTCLLDPVCSFKYDKLKASTVKIEFTVNIENEQIARAYGTGTLINNTNYDGKLYLATANHTFYQKKFSWNEVKFIFNYERSCCMSTGNTNGEVLRGASLLTSDISTDFLLLEINGKYKDISKICFAGWDNRRPSGSINDNGPFFSIHHPKGNEKKIAISTQNANTVTSKPTSKKYSFDVDCWKVTWDLHNKFPAMYFVQHGSSGAGLINNKNRLIGVLSHGPEIEDCNYYSNVKISNYFGAFYQTWENLKGSYRLGKWLTPGSDGAFAVDPIYFENGNRVLREEAGAVCSSLKADFEITNSDIESSGGTVSIINKTTGGKEPIKYEWEFGDGTTSNDINPIKTFSKTDASNISVWLKATDASGSSSFSSPQIIRVNNSTPDPIYNDSRNCPHDSQKPFALGTLTITGGSKTMCWHPEDDFNPVIFANYTVHGTKFKTDFSFEWKAIRTSDYAINTVPTDFITEYTSLIYVNLDKYNPKKYPYYMDIELKIKHKETGNCSYFYERFTIKQGVGAKELSPWVCLGESVTLGDPASLNYDWNYSWSPATGLSNSNIPNPIFTPTEAKNYSFTLEIKNPTNGCTKLKYFGVETRKINLNAGEDFQLTACEGTTDSKQIGQVATGGFGGYKYSWNASPFLSETNIATPTVGSYYSGDMEVFSVTVTDNNNCKATDEVKVTFVPSDLTVNAGNDISSCVNGVVILDAKASGGLGPYTFNWSPIEGLTKIGASGAKVTSLVEGSKEYSVHVQDSKGCKNKDEIIVNFGSSDLSVNAGNDVTICPESGTILEGKATGGQPPYTYSWNNMSPSSAKLEVGGGNHILKVTDASGCSKTDLVKVNVYSQIIANVLSPPTTGNWPFSEICIGESIQINVSIGGGSPPYTYQWYETDEVWNGHVTGPRWSEIFKPATTLNDPNILNPIATPNTSKAYYLKVQDSKGCVRWSTSTSDFPNYLVQVHSNLPTISIVGGVDKVCASATIATQFNPNSHINTNCYNKSSNNFTLAKYAWDFNSEGSSNEYSPFHVFKTPGVKTIKLNVTNACGSFEVKKQIEAIVPNNITIPDASFTFEELCGGKVFFKSSVQERNGYTYKWEIDDVVSCTKDFHFKFFRESSKVKFTVWGPPSPCAISSVQEKEITPLVKEKILCGNIASGTYRAQRIKVGDLCGKGTNATIASGSKVIIYAQSEVVFEPGFNSELSSEMEASILSCQETVREEQFDNYKDEPIESDIQIKEDFTVFPNPTNGSVEISLHSEEEKSGYITVYNMQGFRIMEMECINNNHGKFIIDLSAQTPGGYLIQVFNGKKIFQKSIVLIK